MEEMNPNENKNKKFKIMHKSIFYLNITSLNASLVKLKLDLFVSYGLNTPIEFQEINEKITKISPIDRNVMNKLIEYKATPIKGPKIIPTPIKASILPSIICIWSG